MLPDVAGEYRLRMDVTNLRLKVIAAFLVVLLLQSNWAFATEESVEVDRLYLNHLLEQLRSHESSQDCVFKNSNTKLFKEFQAADDSQTVNPRYKDKEKTEISAFVKIPKKFRPGLSLSIKLNGNKCQSFKLFEVMN
jgi:hypothetical protein